jgi:hypothetical protein
MRRGLDDGYELDDDPSRIDVDYARFGFTERESVPIAMVRRSRR